MKLIVGGAQFGMKYGVTNDKNVISDDELNSLFCFMKNNGLKGIDTAINYGNSEKRIGDNSNLNFQVTTKIPRVDNNLSPAQFKSCIEDYLNQSKNNLNGNTITTVLFHSIENLQLTRDKSKMDLIREILNNLGIKNFGVSIYEESDLSQLEVETIDHIQIPFNPINTNLLTKIDQLKIKYNTQLTVEVRSIFLQGVLIESKNNLHSYFNRFNGVLELWDKLNNGSKNDKMNSIIDIVENDSRIDRYVIGFQCVEELEEAFNIIKAFSNNSKGVNLEVFKNFDKNLIDELSDPRKWKV
jgi:aryl-alcohol dehydrogenase-like predicted oxidoreductase